jgi:hypothetical protein
MSEFGGVRSASELGGLQSRPLAVTPARGGRKRSGRAFPICRRAVLLTVWLVASISTMGVAPAAPQSGGPQDSANVDLAAGAWIASNGEAKNVPDPAKQKQGQVLEWRYTVGGQPLFLAQRKLSGKYPSADTVSFAVKSNREGTLMLRLGTSAGKNYLASFQTGTAWKEVSLRLDSFLAENGGGQLAASSVDSILLADLSGQRREGSGARTIWVTDLRMSMAGSRPAASVNSERPANYAGTWTASAGTVQLVRDPLKQIAAEILEWRYQVSPQTPFIADQHLSGRFPEASAGLTFRARSDKAGLLFMRLVTSKGAFVVNFRATTAWQVFTFGFEQFLSEQGQGHPEAGRIQGIAVADLNGEKKTLSGPRTVWITQVRAIGRNQQPL